MAAPWRWGRLLPVTSQCGPARALRCAPQGWARRGGGGADSWAPAGGGSSSPPGPSPPPAHGPLPRRAAASGGGVAGARSPPAARYPLARGRPGRCPHCTWRAMEERGSAAGSGLPSRRGYPAVRCLGIAVDENNVRPGALQLIRELRPQWQTERVKTKVLSYCNRGPCQRFQ